ncbi:hypothetical protein CHH28_12220 [Bacterioplanes sanyensis]|uniref:DUF4372 domain-containing protein n=1 Tax=Bacterioplanes sanyensis TaxID=1249553 RepID=A0A222FKT4_9GAMM|nr:hypothetical protein CHH28_12220 [Bacterioplanes sanyensis]
MGLGQISDRQSLRDIEASLEAQSDKLYHLGADRQNNAGATE